MNAPTFSVVIPTRDRVDVLARTLNSLEAQRDAPDFEIVIVDDGSADATGRMLAQRRFRVPHQLITQAQAGPAQARNAGIEVADGQWIAFLGSDTAPAENWLHRHWLRHQASTDDSVAVIGRTDWHPNIPASPFLEYINEQGLQFGFALIDDPDDVPFNFFYSSNLSVHRRWLEGQRFDPSFADAAWEDVELGYRLRGAGLRLVYDAEARVLHDHQVDTMAFWARQYRVGYSAVILRDLHPELCHFLGLPSEGGPAPPSRTIVGGVERLAATLEHWPVRTPRLWRYLSNAHYRRGCIAALTERAARVTGGRPQSAP